MPAYHLLPTFFDCHRQVEAVERFLLQAKVVQHNIAWQGCVSVPCHACPDEPLTAPDADIELLLLEVADKITEEFTEHSRRD